MFGLFYHSCLVLRKCWTPVLALHAESWWRVAQREFENGYYNLHINWRVSVQSVVSWDWTELAAAANSVQDLLAAPANSVRDLQAVAASKSRSYRRWPPGSPDLTGGVRQPSPIPTDHGLYTIASKSEILGPVRKLVIIPCQCINTVPILPCHPLSCSYDYRWHGINDTGLKFLENYHKKHLSDSPGHNSKQKWKSPRVHL